jgi:hypothetical protein
LRVAALRALALAIVTLFPALSPVAAATSEQPTTPAAMLGVWGWSAQSCANVNDDGRATIKAHAVAFFAASYQLKDIVILPSGALRAAAITSEEGEPGAARAHIELRLTAPSLLSIRTDAAGIHVYLRCRA